MRYLNAKANYYPSVNVPSYSAGNYRVTHLVGENLLLTTFRQLQQQLGHYCSYSLPRQDDRTPKTQVNGRFSLTRCVTLYVN